MADSKRSGVFPELDEKLNAPKKLTTFERSREAAESKRLQEEEETKRALLEFEQSFAEDDDDPMARLGRQPDSHRGGARGFPPRDRSSDAGSRFAPRSGVDFDRSGAPPGLKRKRELEAIEHERLLARGPLRHNRESHSTALTKDGPTSIRSADSAIRRPTALLQCLPITMTSDSIKALMPASLAVQDVTFVNPKGIQNQARRTRCALVITSAQTPVSDIDNAASALQGKYLGFGCYLKISRHISLASSQPVRDSDIIVVEDSHPFAAKPAVIPQQTQTSLRNAPPPRDLDRVPPPNTFSDSDSRSRLSRPGNVEVAVTYPRDIKQLKLVHRTVEQLLTHGPNFEAVLMSRPSVQQDEKWAWLYDPTSDCGVYYRWLIWRLSQSQNPFLAPVDTSEREVLFDTGPRWACPTDEVKYGKILDFESIVDDSAYESSEDESGDDAAQVKLGQGGALTSLQGDTSDHKAQYLNPYRRAKLTHLLARLPDSMSMLRVGDVARVTHFVVNNASHGAEEIVDMLLTNIQHPFRLSVCYDDDPRVRQHVVEPDQARKDLSGQKLIGLYLVSDILQASSVSGVRDAWKYRSLFESALSARKTLESLGRLDKELDWGRIKAEQWKRKVNLVLSLWEQRSIFGKEAHDAFKKSFDEPPLTAEEVKEIAETKRREKADSEARKWKSHGDSSDSKMEDVSVGDKVQDQQTSTDAIAQRIAAIKQKAAMNAAMNAAAATAPGTNTAAPLAVLQPAPPSVTSSSTHIVDKTGFQPLAEEKRARPTAADLNVASPLEHESSMPSAKKGFGFSMSFDAPIDTPDSESVEAPRKPAAKNVFDADDGLL